MDDRTLVTRLLRLGLTAHEKNPSAFVTPSEDPELRGISVATIANWLEELGRHRLIGEVQPCFTAWGPSFRFQITDVVKKILGDPQLLDDLLGTLDPASAEFDIFISYTGGDRDLAGELWSALKQKNLTCFMAERDIRGGNEFEDEIRKAMSGSKRVLLLLTPRSITRPWVLVEAGAAWVLRKPLIPVTLYVEVEELVDPIRRQQTRLFETAAQRQALVEELSGS